MIVLLIFIEIENIRRKEEEIDWIMKYFILISVIFFFSFSKVFMRAQNERVFISSITQMEIHEFITRHIPLEIIKIIIMNGAVFILLCSNCKFDFFWELCKIC